MVKISTAEQFAQVVFDRYIHSGEVATFQELAAYAECSVSSLRKIFSAVETCVPGVEVTHEDRPVVCQTSGGALRHRKVKVLCPTASYMRRKYKGAICLCYECRTAEPSEPLPKTSRVRRASRAK